MAITRCPYCHAIIDEADKYCNNCGTQLLFPEDEELEEEIPGEKILDADTEEKDYEIREPGDGVRQPDSIKGLTEKEDKDTREFDEELESVLTDKDLEELIEAEALAEGEDDEDEESHGDAEEVILVDEIEAEEAAASRPGIFVEDEEEDLGAPAGAREEKAEGLKDTTATLEEARTPSGFLEESDEDETQAFTTDLSGPAEPEEETAELAAPLPPVPATGEATGGPGPEEEPEKLAEGEEPLEAPAEPAGPARVETGDLREPVEAGGGEPAVEPGLFELEPEKAEAAKEEPEAPAEPEPEPAAPAEFEPSDTAAVAGESISAETERAEEEPLDQQLLGKPIWGEEEEAGVAEDIPTGDVEEPPAKPATFDTGELEGIGKTVELSKERLDKFLEVMEEKIAKDEKPEPESRVAETPEAETAGAEVREPSGTLPPWADGMKGAPSFEDIGTTSLEREPEEASAVETAKGESVEERTGEFAEQEIFPRRKDSDSTIGLPERVTQAVLPFEEAAAGEEEEEKEEEEPAEPEALRKEGPAVEPARPPLEVAREEPAAAEEEEEEERRPFSLSIFLKSRAFDVLFAGVFWLVALWFAAYSMGTTLFELFSLSGGSLILLYGVFLGLYFFLFKFFLGETLGDRLFTDRE